ncbi:MAG: phosphate/phosphite/phosphonate ABC transporter substrate-binding protein [Roseibium sp.]
MKQYIMTAAGMLFFSLFCGAALADTLVVGSINSNIKKETARFAPLASYLSAKLKNAGVSKTEIKVLPTSEAMSTAMMSGDVDLFIDSPLTAARVVRSAGAVPLLRRWKDGVSEYHSVIMTLADSPLKDLTDLNGKLVAFQHADSSSGFVIPAAHLNQAGLSLLKMENARDDIPDGRTGFVFSGSDKYSVALLSKGWVDAAGTDNETFDEVNQDNPGKFRVLSTSVSVPRHVVLHAADMKPELVTKIHAVLMEAETLPEGQEMLEDFDDTVKFDPFPGGMEATFEPIYEILDSATSIEGM